MTTHELYDEATGQPTLNGLLSPRMGPHACMAGIACSVCGQHASKCAGHHGHIDLPWGPVPHPLFPHVLISVLLVPPPSLRAPHVCNGRRHQHAWTQLLRAIMRARSAASGRAALKRYFFDCRDRTPGISTKLRGKEGFMRHRLLGRRTGYTARAVVTPCTDLPIDVVGVPQRFAQTLTIPERVAPYNLQRLRATPGVHPAHPRLGDLVERPLQDGDVVVLNRQPTLSSESLCGMKVRLIPAAVLQINPLLCATFNADFDGDEMNLFVCRTVHARAEALELMHPSRCQLRFIQDAATDEPAGSCPPHEMHGEQLRRLERCDARGLSVTLNDIAGIQIPRGVTFAAAAQHAVERTNPRNALVRMVRGGKGKAHNLVSFAKFGEGLSAREYFEGARVVRESLVKTYMNTPQAGYLSRKLGAMLDGLRCEYDGTLRVCQQAVVRFDDLGFEPGQHVGAQIAANLSKSNTQTQLDSFHHAGVHSRVKRVTVQQLLLGNFKAPAYCEGATPQQSTPPASCGRPAPAMTDEERTFHFVTTGRWPPRGRDATRTLFAHEHAETLAEAFDFCWTLPDGRVVVTHTGAYAERKVGVRGSPAFKAADFAEHVLPAMPRDARCDNVNYVCSALGIEAARQAMREIAVKLFPSTRRNELDAYLDFVCYTGAVRYATRNHIQDAQRPIASAGFETTLAALQRAANANVTDHLVDPSSQIIFNGTVQSNFDAMTCQPTPVQRAGEAPARTCAPCQTKANADNLVYKPYVPVTSA